MEKTFTAETEATPDELFEVIADLGTYPEWLEVVGAADVEPGDEPAWIVTLRARIGPLSRSKRLRMCRTRHTPRPGEGGDVMFERCETDGREHSAWIMKATVSPVDEAAAGAGSWASAVQLTLSYDGGMWSGPLDGLLDVAAGRATDRLRRHLSPQRN